MRPSASDHLANERTFLAYLRTAVAFVGLGFVVARFGIFIREAAAIGQGIASGTSGSTVLGIAMVAGGIVVAAFGFYRYATVTRALLAGGAPELSIKGAAAVAAFFGIFGALVVYLLYRTWALS
jgi:putative membrane protein